jgi:hypothetical protein
MHGISQGLDPERFDPNLQHTTIVIPTCFQPISPMPGFRDIHGSKFARENPLVQIRGLILVYHLACFIFIGRLCVQDTRILSQPPAQELQACRPYRLQHSSLADCGVHHHVWEIPTLPTNIPRRIASIAQGTLSLPETAVEFALRMACIYSAVKNVICTLLEYVQDLALCNAR